MHNIEYKTDKLCEYYSEHRCTWRDLYTSEKYVFSLLAERKGSLGSVLDVGCACGGLGMALKEKEYIESYHGIDINKQCVDWAAKALKDVPGFRFTHGDVLVANGMERSYDTVISLSCADWNVETRRIIEKCWEMVREGGHLVISLRISAPEKKQFGESIQYINFEGQRYGELAPYVVYSFENALSLFGKMTPRPSLCGCYGYFGEPSKTAVTDHNRLLFTVFYIEKGPGRAMEGEMRLPMEMFGGTK